MLVLSRKVGEVVNIGKGIRIMVTALHAGNRVTMGITAPETVSVCRKELYGTPQTEDSSVLDETTTH